MNLDDRLLLRPKQEVHVNFVLKQEHHGDEQHEQRGKWLRNEADFCDSFLFPFSIAFEKKKIIATHSIAMTILGVDYQLVHELSSTEGW